MSNVLTVDLKGRVKGGASIEFLRAEMNGSMVTPFALIRYAVDGIEPKTGLRIDLDKRAILDRLDDPETDAVIERAGPQIAEVIGPVAYQRDLTIRSHSTDAHLRGATRVSHGTDALLVHPTTDSSDISRTVLLLTYDGLTPSEIAARVGLPTETVLEVRDAVLAKLVPNVR